MPLGKRIIRMCSPDNFAPGWRRDFYTFIELETTNTALHEAQTADDAEKPARLATGVPETEQHPSRVQQYVADRKRLLADRSKVGLLYLEREQC